MDKIRITLQEGKHYFMEGTKKSSPLESSNSVMKPKLINIGILLYINMLFLEKYDINIPINIEEYVRDYITKHAFFKTKTMCKELMEELSVGNRMNEDGILRCLISRFRFAIVRLVRENRIEKFNSKTYHRLTQT